MNVLELYSGIGGMHLALKESEVNGKVVAAIEINNAANEIYEYNFPNTKLLNLNIEGLTPNFIHKLGVDTILMSPPCQPFTRNGLQNDTRDPRTSSFLHLMKILPELKQITRLLVENVKGFEQSHARDVLIKTLQECGFSYQEFIISPHQFGIPNSRHRYYCLAKKHPETFSFEIGQIMDNLPQAQQNKECFPISNILEYKVDDEYLLSENLLLKHLGVLDICYLNSRRSCCFTKAYGRYVHGTGSVFTNKTVHEVKEISEKIDTLRIDDCDRFNLLKSLNLRFFTPKEICRLMCFPESYNFPNNITNRKKYMLLGNSINVKVVSELIKLLYN
ncbi:hypothetical protein NQ315_002077 [Exocentrus adspersus]|uniref:DNA methyltransferase 2 n=1 Tax=Exocentrus adspersus TaxID=1586481 RepID=A0AAV8V912_9CUCU|nr:hypothetical protein NQ315_002077 [Exocentrus adspersus]